MTINCPIVALLACTGLCWAAGECAAKPLLLDHKRDALSLAGTWDILLEHGDREVWKPDVAAHLGPWKPVDVPSFAHRARRWS